MIGALLVAAGLFSSAGPTACVAVGCTEYTYTEASGYLYCADTAGVYDLEGDDTRYGDFPPGHWTFVAAEQGDMTRNLQSFGYAVVEY